MRIMLLIDSGENNKIPLFASNIFHFMPVKSYILPTTYRLHSRISKQIEEALHVDCCKR